MTTFDPILTERLLIRRIEEYDAEELLEYRRMPEVYNFQGFKPENPEDAVEFIKLRAIKPNIPGSRYQLAVCLREPVKLIGDIGLRFLEDGCQVEIGYTIHPLFQGQGYAFESVSAVYDYLFKTLGKHRITASIDPENNKSIKLCEKLGMRKEAHFVKSLLIRGEWADDIIYAVLAEEWLDK